MGEFSACLRRGSRTRCKYLSDTNERIPWKHTGNHEFPKGIFPPINLVSPCGRCHSQQCCAPIVSVYFVKRQDPFKLSIYREDASMERIEDHKLVLSCCHWCSCIESVVLAASRQSSWQCIMSGRIKTAAGSEKCPIALTLMIWLTDSCAVVSWQPKDCSCADSDLLLAGVR